MQLTATDSAPVGHEGGTVVGGSVFRLPATHTTRSPPKETRTAQPLCPAKISESALAEFGLSPTLSCSPSFSESASPFSAVPPAAGAATTTSAAAAALDHHHGYYAEEVPG